MSQFTIADAIGAYKTYLDHNHKLFAYLQVVGTGAAVFVWSRERSPAVVCGVLVVFLVIALFNGVLLWHSQRSLIVIAASIQQFCARDDFSVPAELRPVVSTYRAYGLFSIMLLYSALTALGCVAVVAAM